MPEGVTKRSIASMKILQHSARRKTPLTNAPKISARCQPYEYWSVAVFADSFRTIRVHWTGRKKHSPAHLDRVQRDNQAQDVAEVGVSGHVRQLLFLYVLEHMKRVCDESERAYGVS